MRFRYLDLKMGPTEWPECPFVGRMVIHQILGAVELNASMVRTPKVGRGAAVGRLLERMPLHHARGI